MKLALVALVLGGCQVVFPLDLPGPDQQTAQLAIGASHTCRLTADGKVFCWGRGALGGPDQRDIITLAQTEVALPSRATKIDAGDGFTCALLHDTSVTCWGVGDRGQLGDGRGVDDSPVKVSLPGPAIDLAVGENHACAQLDAGAGVACWGANGNGQVGAPAATKNLLLPAIVPGSEGATGIGVGERHSCILFDGQPSCFGRDATSQLGFVPGDPDGAYPTPEPIAGFTAVDQIVGGTTFTCGLEASGDVRCLGGNDRGELGRESADDPSPSVVTVSGALDLAAGSQFACARLDDGRVRCWGDGSRGERGDGIFQARATAVELFSADANVIGIAVGYHHGCAIERDGVACWGSDTFGELGRGTRAISDVPASVTVPAAPSMLSMAGDTDSGNGHSCAVIDGEVYCWGFNHGGELGDSTRIGRSTPTKITTGLPSVDGVAVGSAHACAWNGIQVRCWGNNTRGQLGDATTLDSDTPVTVVGTFAAPIVKMALGRDHTCALVGTIVFCWGDNTRGQVGNSAVTDFTSSPVGAGIPGGHPIDGLTAGAAHTCARAENSTLFCWGANESGQIDDTGVDLGGATQVPTGIQFTGVIAAGESHTCAVSTSSFELYCWGGNVHGELGIGTTTSVSTPTRVKLPGDPDQDVIELVATDRGTCARGFNNHVYCWGSGLSGELGNGEVVPFAMSPVEVSGIDDATAIARGGDGACAVRQTSMQCWGNDDGGKLALGLGVAASMPMPIAQ